VSVASAVPQQQQQQQQQQLHQQHEGVKVEPEYQISPDASEHNPQADTFDEIEMDANDVSEIDEDPMEQQQQQQEALLLLPPSTVAFRYSPAESAGL